MRANTTLSIIKACLLASQAKATANDKDLFVLEKLEQDMADIMEAAIKLKVAMAKSAMVDDLMNINGEDPLPEKHYIAISAKGKTIDGELKHLKSQMDRLPTLQSELAAVAARQHIRPFIENAGAINPALVSQVIEQDMDAQVDDDGKLRVKMKDGKSVEGFLAEMPQSAEYRHLFGGGRATNPQQANNPYGVNPWLPVSHNLTMQGKIFKENPVLAAKLQAEADQYKVKR